MKKFIVKLYNEIALFSPKNEVFLRKLYWKNVERLHFLSPNKSNRIERSVPLDFNLVLDFLSKNGIGEGSTMIVHSSYANLKPLPLSPDEVNNELIKLVGNGGTLAMPVIRSFEEDNLSLNALLEDKISDIECTYNVQKTKVTSGVLASTLMMNSESVISKFPLNPLTAYGLLAEKMMRENINGDLPSPHGPNSAWKFCADQNAFVVYLGIDFGHHLTMQQVSAECNENWGLEDFYLERKFKIIDGEEVIYKTVKERRHKWTMFLAEKNVRKELLDAGIIKAINIEGVPVSVFKSKELLDYYNNHKNKTFPYYV